MNLDMPTLLFFVQAGSWNIVTICSKKREAVPDLAPILWHSVGTIACLLQEIVAIYPLLSPPKLKAPASNRYCPHIFKYSNYLAGFVMH